jgi:hypothetical protein
LRLPGRVLHTSTTHRIAEAHHGHHHHQGAGGAPWVFGAFRAFVPESAQFVPIVNFYQTNNVFVADQLNVQMQTIDINSSAANAVINVVAGQNAVNFKLG